MSSHNNRAVSDRKNIASVALSTALRACLHQLPTYKTINVTYHIHYSTGGCL